MRNSDSESKTSRCGLIASTCFEDRGDRVGQLDLRGMEDGVLGLRAEIVVGGNHLVNSSPSGSSRASGQPAEAPLRTPRV